MEAPILIRDRGHPSGAGFAGRLPTPARSAALYVGPRSPSDFVLGIRARSGLRRLLTPHPSDGLGIELFSLESLITMLAWRLKRALLALAGRPPHAIPRWTLSDRIVFRTGSHADLYKEGS